MGPNRHLSRNAFAVVTAALVVFACSDVTEVAPLRIGQPQGLPDVLAEGSAYAAFWKPVDGRLSFKGAVSVPLRVARQNGATVAVPLGPAIADSDAVFAEQLQHELTAVQFRSSAGALRSNAVADRGSHTKVPMRLRTMVTKVVNGTKIKVAFAPDDDKKSGRPPKAIMIWENNKPVAIIQSSYTKKSGVWRANKSRTLVLDGSGKVATVVDLSQDVLSYASGSSAPSVFGRIRKGSGDVLRLVAQAVRPDVLYAAAVDEQEACWQEAAALAGAAGALAIAIVVLSAAEASLIAAQLGLAAAITSCVPTGPACLLAIAAALAALASAELGLTAAAMGMTLAILGVQGATAFLIACIWPDTQTGPSGGGGQGSCEGEDVEWCQWTVWYNGEGEVVSVEEDYCWCQDPHMT